jgi:probable F420-dependent oxidoreductase
MRFAISIPQGCPDGTFDPPAFAAYLLRAEQLGFESAWAMDMTFGRPPRLNALETMTFAAAAPTRLRLGCSVWISPLHQPVQLAKSLSTLDQLSGGRLEIGFGSGGPHRMFSAFGLSGDHLISRFTEGIAVMKALWTEPEVTFDGRFYQLRGATMEPKPVQKPYPPIWFGGSAPAGMRRAVRHGDGFMGAGSQTVPQFAEQVRIVREQLSAQGRDPETFRIGKRVYLHVDDDASRGARRLEEALTHHYGRGGWSEHILTGPPEACAAGIRRVADAGAELILLNPMIDDAEQLERLSAEVIPALG